MPQVEAWLLGRPTPRHVVAAYPTWNAGRKLSGSFMKADSQRLVSCIDSLCQASSTSATSLHVNCRLELSTSAAAQLIISRYLAMDDQSCYLVGVKDYADYGGRVVPEFAQAVPDFPHLDLSDPVPLPRGKSSSGDHSVVLFYCNLETCSS